MNNETKNEAKVEMLEEDVREFKTDLKKISDNIVEIGKTLIKLNINYDNLYNYAHDQLHEIHNLLNEFDIRIGLLEKTTEELKKEKKEKEEETKSLKNRFGNIIEKIIILVVGTGIGIVMNVFRK